MSDKNDLFDIRMKEKFKDEVSKIPENINEEFENTLKFIKSKESKNMKKLNKKKKAGIVAASILCASMAIMQTTFAKDIVNDIIRALSLNSITIFENQDYKWKDKEIPEVAKGKLFDKDKKVIEKITLANKDAMFTANGEQVFGVDTDGTLITKKVQMENMKKNAEENPVQVLKIEDASKLNDYACFDIKLPTYLPEGFEFEFGEFTKDLSRLFKHDDDNHKFVDLNFINKKTGENITMHQNYTSKKSSSETSFNNIEKVKVNGADAIVGDEGIVWESNNVRYLMYTDFGKDENIKIAESFK